MIIAGCDISAAGSRPPLGLLAREALRPRGLELPERRLYVPERRLRLPGADYAPNLWRALSVTNIGTNGIAASGSSITITGVTVPAGSLIVAIGAEGDTTSVGGTISDGTNGSYTGPTASGNMGGSSSHGWSGLFYFPNSAALSGATITYTLAAALSTGQAATLSAFYITGALAVSPLDTAVTATSSAGAASPSVTSGTPSTSDMLVAWAAVNLNTTYNQDSTHSWVAPPTAVQAPSAGHMSFGGGSQVASVATQFSPTFNSGTSSWAAIVGFKGIANAFTSLQGCFVLP